MNITGYFYKLYLLRTVYNLCLKKLINAYMEGLLMERIYTDGGGTKNPYQNSYPVRLRLIL